MAQRAKAAVMSIASNERHSIVRKAVGQAALAWLAVVLCLRRRQQSPAASRRSKIPALGGSAPYDRSTAVYDISAKMVYLPDGTKLEAHSGLGSELDDPHPRRSGCAA